MLNFKKVHFLLITLGVPVQPETLHLPFFVTLFACMYCQWEILVRDRSWTPATKRKTEFLKMQNKIQIIKPDKGLLSSFTHTHTHTHTYLFKITKANNLALCSYHVLLCQKRKPCLDSDSHMLLDRSLILFKHSKWFKSVVSNSIPGGPQLYRD